MRLYQLLIAIITAALLSAGCPRSGIDPDEPRMSFSAVGKVRPEAMGMELFGPEAGTRVMADLAPFLQSRDLAMAGLAGGYGPDCGARPGAFFWTPDGLEHLFRANVRVISLADQSALDCGPDWLVRAMEGMLARGFYPVGAGRDQTEARAPVYLVRNNVTVALAAVFLNNGGGPKPNPDGPGPALYDSNALNQALAEMSKRSHHQVVVFHLGERELPELHEREMAAVRQAIDFGAELVICYGPAMAGGLHRVRGRWVIAGMGRTAGEPSSTRDKACDGLVLSIEFAQDRIAGARIAPTEIKDGKPGYLRGEKGRLALQKILQPTTREVQDNSTIISDILYLR